MYEWDWPQLVLKRLKVTRLYDLHNNKSAFFIRCQSLRMRPSFFIDSHQCTLYLILCLLF